MNTKLTTTLARIRSHSPCELGYTRLVKSLGGVRAYGDEAEINLLTILDVNGVQDMLWCLRATIEDSRAVASRLALAFAEQALAIFEENYPADKRPRNAIQGARDHLAGKIDSATLRNLRAAAVDAASAASGAASASDASGASADAASAYAAADAADAAAYASGAAYAASASSGAAYAADAAYAAADAAAAYAVGGVANPDDGVYENAYTYARAGAGARQAEIIRSILK